MNVIRIMQILGLVGAISLGLAHVNSGIASSRVDHTWVDPVDTYDPRPSSEIVYEEVPEVLQVPMETTDPYNLKENPMINKEQLREMVEDTLREMQHVIPYSQHAAELILMTAAHESHMGTYLRQVKGPARGIFQMEPATEADIHKNYLAYKEDLREYVDTFRTEHPETDLQYNLKYQIVMARVFYRRLPAALPKNEHEYAKYAKKFWNTHLGKATVDDYLSAYRKHARKISRG